MRKLPSQAWEKYLADADKSALLAVLLTVPYCASSQKVGFPFFHRICDIELGGQSYRIGRLVDPASGEETLFVSPTDVPDYQAPGVPYQLSGKALRRWIEDELECSTDGPVDWDVYLNG